MPAAYATGCMGRKSESCTFHEICFELIQRSSQGRARNIRVVRAFKEASIADQCTLSVVFGFDSYFNTALAVPAALLLALDRGRAPRGLLASNQRLAVCSGSLLLQLQLRLLPVSIS